MHPAPGATLGAGTATVARVPLQAVDPAALTGLSGPVRGAAVFVAVLVLGAGLTWRRGALVERSIAESTDRPLSAMGYGVAAHGVIAFGGVYLATRLTEVEAGGWNAGALGAAGGVLALLLAGALGFTVVGSVLADLGGRGGRWAGAVVGAAIAGGAAAVEPLVGVVVWFVVVSTGIGGPVRAWVHASAGPDR